MCARHPIATVPVSSAAVRCTLLPCVLACDVMVYMTLMLCPWKTRLLSPVYPMRVAVDEEWLEHSVTGSHLDSPRCVVCGSALCTVLQYGLTPLILAAWIGQADAVQALLDAGADRFAEVRMTPCSLMTAHEIILSMGYGCSSLSVYVVVHPRCADDDVSC